MLEGTTGTLECIVTRRSIRMWWDVVEYKLSVVREYTRASVFLDFLGSYSS